MVIISIQISLPLHVGGLHIRRADEHLKIERRNRKLEIFYPSLSSQEIKLAALYLKKYSRQAHERPILETIEILNQIHDVWMDPNFEFKKEMEQVLSILTGQSEQMINFELEMIIDLFEKENLISYISHQFGDYRYLDEWVQQDEIFLHAQPRGLILHSLAGNSFVLGPLSLLHGILTKNINLAKVASSEPYFTVRFVQSIQDIDRNFAKELGVMYWKGKQTDIYEFLFDEELIDVVTAWGGLNSIKELKKISALYGVKFIEHGPKFSFSIITEDSLGDVENLISLATKIVKDVVIWNQYACSSPRVVFVQEKDNTYKINLNGSSDNNLQNEILTCMQEINGSVQMAQIQSKSETDSKLRSIMSESMNQLRRIITSCSALGFAKLLSLQFDELSKKFSRTKMTEAEALNTLNKRDFYLFNSESQGWGKVFVPTDNNLTQNTDWTVIYLRKLPSISDIDACVNRLIIVTPFQKLEEIEKWIEKMQIKRFIQTFSICGKIETVKKFANSLTSLGACTITLPGEMNIHKLVAPHDGSYDLKELVRWVSINTTNQN